jgi:hypothetical protein
MGWAGQAFSQARAISPMWLAPKAKYNVDEAVVVCRRGHRATFSSILPIFFILLWLQSNMPLNGELSDPDSSSSESSINLKEYLAVTEPLLLKLCEVKVLKCVPGFCATKLRIWAYRG